MLEQQIIIRRPVLDVFDFLLDVDRVWQWAPYFLATEVVKKDKQGWPRVYRARVGYTWQLSYETEVAITDYQRGRSVSYRAVDPPQVATYLIEPAASGSIVTARHSPWGIPGFDVLRTAIDTFSLGLVRQALVGLRDLLESMPASGRPVAFLSYRRNAAPYIAGRIVEALGKEFGANSIFQDIASIRVGGPADEAISSAIKMCDATVVLVDSGWLRELEKRKERGKKDYIRIEVAAALESGKDVLPVALDGVDIDRTRAELPADLAALDKFQWQRLRHDPDFSSDIGRVIDAIWDRILASGPSRKTKAPPRPKTMSETGAAGWSTLTEAMSAGFAAASRLTTAFGRSLAREFTDDTPTT